MDKFSFLNAAHTGFIADLYDQYLQNPDAVEPSWRSFFQGYDLANEKFSLTEDEELSVEIPQSVRKEFLVVDLINGYRTRGHLFTKTNPVRERRDRKPLIDPENFGLCQEDMQTVFEAGKEIGIGAATLAQIVDALKTIYDRIHGDNRKDSNRNPQEREYGAKDVGSHRRPRQTGGFPN